MPAVKNNCNLNYYSLIPYRPFPPPDISDTIISKERGQPHNHANHMLWGWERFYMNLQNFVPDTQVDISMGPNNPTLGPMS